MGESSRTASEPPCSNELSASRPCFKGLHRESSHEPGGSDAVRELSLRKRPPPTEGRGQIFAKIGKRGFRGQKNSHFPVSQKLALESQIPIFLVEPCREMGFFDSKRPPISGILGNGSFLTPNPKDDSKNSEISTP